MRYSVIGEDTPTPSRCPPPAGRNAPTITRNAQPACIRLAAAPQAFVDRPRPILSAYPLRHWRPAPNREAPSTYIKAHIFELF